MPRNLQTYTYTPIRISSTQQASGFWNTVIDLRDWDDEQNLQLAVITPLKVVAIGNVNLKLEVPVSPPPD